MSCMSTVAFEACFEGVVGGARGRGRLKRRGLPMPQSRCRRLNLGQELVAWKEDDYSALCSQLTARDQTQGYQERETEREVPRTLRLKVEPRV